MQPPSGGCVLKRGHETKGYTRFVAAAFGRLCVETPVSLRGMCAQCGSRLRAAVC